MTIPEGAAESAQVSLLQKDVLPHIDACNNRYMVCEKFPDVLTAFTVQG